jgi:hypothetical protein
MEQNGKYRHGLDGLCLRPLLVFEQDTHSDVHFLWHN